MKDPAFLFYTSDFLTGIMFMTNEEVGKYIRTLCLLHQHGGRLPREKIEMVVGKLPDNVMEKFEIDKNGNMFNERLLLETNKRNSFCLSRKENIKHRYEKPTYVKHMNTHMENENENINKDISFIDKLKTNIAYKYINIDIELAKMDAWLLTHPGRQKTKRFIVNWLNKIDKPVVIEKPRPKEEPKKDPNLRYDPKVSELVRATAKALK